MVVFGDFLTQAPQSHIFLTTRDKRISHKFIYYSGVIWSSWSPEPTKTPLFVQQVIRIINRGK